jgi:hypothetical protein
LSDQLDQFGVVPFYRQVKEQNMPHIVVDDAQARIISESAESIEIRDQSGKHLGYVAHGFSEDDIAIARRRMESTEPRYTTRELVDYLESLEQE